MGGLNTFIFHLHLNEGTAFTGFGKTRCWVGLGFSRAVLSRSDEGFSLRKDPSPN
jgi:hypothetical protein